MQYSLVNLPLAMTLSCQSGESWDTLCFFVLRYLRQEVYQRVYLMPIKMVHDEEIQSDLCRFTMELSS